MENKKKISKVVYIVVGIVLVLAAAFAVFAVRTGLFGKNEVNNEVQITYYLSVAAQGQEIYSGEVNTAEGTVLMDSMVSALEAEDIEVVYENSEYGAYITAIGGYAQNYEENLYWSFTVNGELVMEGASTLVPAEGDEVVFTLEEIVW